MKEPTDVGSPIIEFLNNSLDQIGKGLEKRGYKSCSQSEAEVQLNLNVIQSVDKEGKLILKIIELGKGSTNTNGQSITIYAKKDRGWEEEFERGQKIRKKEEIKQQVKKLHSI